MGEVRSRLTVYFEDPFWIGVFECIENKKLSVCKVTFGAEPTDAEIQEFILNNYYSLRFSPAVTTVVKETKKNPKRLQREAKKQMLNTGIGTKSQVALKLQQEKNKQERKVRSKEEKEAEKLRMFELKQQKRLEKHKGH
ncbi:MAG: YjdF family protein [Saccharofermentans sp.]|nr:YjdF family protein [Saccharofermentans sp.]